MRATCRLFKHCKIVPEKSFIVEGVINYLSTLDYLEFVDINYFKFDKIDPTLKLEISQELIEMLNSNDYNYLVIQNGELSTLYTDTRPYFYFITNKTWKSQNCIELSLYLDTVNTFAYNTDYVISDKTKVLREHRDRFKVANNTEVILENSHAVRCNLYWIDLQEWHGEVDLLPNPSLIGLQNYTIEVSGNGTATLNTTTGVIHLTARGATYDGQEVWIYFKVIVNYGNQLIKNIDDYPEGINPPLYRGKDSEIIQPYNTSWNLIYRNRDNIDPDQFNQVNPVECFVCPDDPILVSSATQTSITYSSLEENKYYYIAVSNNDGISLRFQDNQSHIYELTENKNYNYGYNSESATYIVIFRPQGSGSFTIYYHTYSKIYSKNVTQYYVNEVSYEGVGITTLNILSSINSVKALKMDTDASQPFDIRSNTTFSFTPQSKYLLSLDSLDRTDSRLIKVIKLPYCPSEYSINNNNEIKLDSNWTYDNSTGFFKLNNLNTKFGYKFLSNFENPLYNVLEAPNTFDTSKARDIEYETKLLNSEFYYPKFVYDSFGYIFKMEAFNPNVYIGALYPTEFGIYFKATSTINSKFLFTFPQYIVKDYKKDEDYEAVLPIARNNEVVLYNNQYINYLRTGYNYDLKNKNRTEMASGITTALGIVGAIASAGLGIASGNPAVAVGGVIGGISSATASIVSNVNTIASAENSMASKIEQLKSQSTSTSGSDDIDLLEAYSNNRAKLTEYRVSDRMRQALFDLFYYCGYATNEMKVPSITSRYWFNYLQAELEINGSNNLPDFVIKDLINRFKNGVTILHGHTVSNVLTWDFAQTKENWEVSLLQ